MTSQKGFTLPEILTIASTLALLAAIAVPRYIALNSTTRSSSVTALATHVESSARLTNRVWESAGQPSRVVIKGRIIDMEHGYPTDQSIADIVINGGEYAFSDGYWKHAATARDQRCAVLYIPPSTDGGQLQVLSYTDGC